MSDENNNGHNSKNSTGVIEKTKQKTKKPAMYKVIMLNDDYTQYSALIPLLKQWYQRRVLVLLYVAILDRPFS